MAYCLGIDLGTTYTAAGFWRGGTVGIESLGYADPVIPSVVLAREDGELLVGDAATQRAILEPQRVAREFKRRFGDPTPIVMGDRSYTADELTAVMLRWVTERVSEAEGGPPDGVTVAHPANWGSFKLDLLREAMGQAGLDVASLLSEPEAAAVAYAFEWKVPDGAVVAVYDLGGGTFDAAVLQRRHEGWELLGRPEGIERLGGIDFDQAVLQHVAEAVDGAFEQLDPDDPAAILAMARLRRDCVAAKETLSSDVEAAIPVMLPSAHTTVRLSRDEFEDMVRPAVADSVAALGRALEGASIRPDDLSVVLLVGGSSRIPLIADLVGESLGRPAMVDRHPKQGVALGAAITAAARHVVHASTAPPAAAAPGPPLSPPEPVAAQPPATAPRRWRRDIAVAASAAAVALLIAGYVATSRSDSTGAVAAPGQVEVMPNSALSDPGLEPPVEGRLSGDLFELRVDAYGEVDQLDLGLQQVPTDAAESERWLVANVQGTVVFSTAGDLPAFSLVVEDQHVPLEGIDTELLDGGRFAVAASVPVEAEVVDLVVSEPGGGEQSWSLLTGQPPAGG